MYAELRCREITWLNKAITNMGGEALEVSQALDEGKIHAGKRRCYRGCVFNMFSYEKPMVFLASRQKEELKKIHIQLGLFSTLQGKFLQQNQKKGSRRALEKGIANLDQSPCPCVQVSHLQVTCWETLILHILFLHRTVILEKHLFACVFNKERGRAHRSQQDQV